MLRKLFVVAILLGLASATVGSSVSERLEARILSPKPCKAAEKDPQPPAKKQFLDQRLPVTVNEYHPNPSGFEPSHIDDKEVDRAARRILRQIQKQEAEAKDNDPNAANPPVVEMTTEEHTAFKQLLLDSDILVNAVKKLASENGPIDAPKLTAAKVAVAAVKEAAKLEKNKPKAAAASPVVQASAPAKPKAASAKPAAKPAAKKPKAKKPKAKKNKKSAPKKTTK